MSTELKRRLAQGEVDVALVKRNAGEADCLAAWPETLVWVQARGFTLPAGEPVPLALFPQGCVYRQRALRGLDKARRRWREAFGSHSLTGIQAAVASGLGISVLPTSAVLPEHELCEGMPALSPTELALVAAPGAVLSRAQQALVEHLQDALGPT